MSGIYHQVPFYLSSELDLDIKVYIGHLHRQVYQDEQHRGEQEKWEEEASEYYVSVQLFQSGLAQHEIPCATQVASMRRGQPHWDEWITIPFRLRDLTRFDQISVCLVGVGHRILAGSTVRLFDHKMRLKRGLQQLMLWPTLSSISKAHVPGVDATFDDSWPPKRPGVPGPEANSDQPRTGTDRDGINATLHGHPSEPSEQMNGDSTMNGHATTNGERFKEEKFSLDPKAPSVSLYYWDEDFHLAKLREKYEHHDIQHIPWLDRLTIRQLESHRNRRTESVGGENVHPTGIKLFDAKQLQVVDYAGGKKDVVAVPASDEKAEADTETTSKGNPQPLILYIHFPYFDHEVVYDEQIYEANFLPFATSSSSTQSLWEIPDSGPDPATNPWASRLNIVPDPEMGATNPVELKYKKLARGLVRTLVDPNLKPNRTELQQIDQVINRPNYRLDPEESSLLWRFRYSLLSNPKALPKFVFAVDWNDESESSLATELIEKWAPIDADDALRLLSPDFRHSTVRRFAVNTLHRCTDEELVNYLLQLVQALRYEPQLNGISEKMQSSVALEEEEEEGAYDPAKESKTPSTADGDSSHWLSPLADFLIHRAGASPLLANYFHWYLTVELEDSAFGAVFAHVHSCFLDHLKEFKKGRRISQEISHQVDFVRELMSVVEAAKGEKSIEKKTSTLKEYLKPGGMYNTLTNLGEPVLFPLDPRFEITGIQSNKCKVFRSSVYPTLFVVSVQKSDPERILGEEEDSASSSSRKRASSGAAKEEEKSQQEQESFQVLVKLGDDLRQDQLIIQMIQLMDRCLKKVNVDLQLTPYRVLATGTRSGMMEFVTGSCALEKVKNDIIGFFKKKHPSEHDPYGVDKNVGNLRFALKCSKLSNFMCLVLQVMTTYVQSCAGYCVITYLLGVGDRHFDNLLIRVCTCQNLSSCSCSESYFHGLQDTGHLFHIDFGYIFGNDPKPLPPPMKITKHMIQGMGGVKSEYYKQFRKYCCQGYTIIRRSANLFLNLLNLMRDAGIADMGAHPEVTLMKVQEKFRLDVNDEQAERYFLQLVDESVAALFPHLTDFIHNIVTRWR
eukprot:gb/GECG01006392.1/.p1 GENE.gb/GECG01006392.1/~~gb/GECG01006392.1/.p1  ORF type:complete len:1074 (+),score=112.44 gb/GECG01006392.1/:1-3222(+)